MITRFAKVEDGIFRGSAPSVQDVVNLKEKHGVNRIISLDAIAADKISRTCKLLNIEHVIIPFQCKNFELAQQLSTLNLIKLMESNKPTFVHCAQGKDRTGLFVALYRKQKGISSEVAIAEADKYDFCKGLSRGVREKFVQIINSCGPFKSADENSAIDGYGGYAGVGFYDSIDSTQSSQSIYSNVSPAGDGVSTEGLLTKKQLDNLDSGNNLPIMGDTDSSFTGNGFSSGNGISGGNGNWQIHFAGAKMRTKKAFSVQMSYDVTNTEKMRAEKCLKTFSQFIAVLETFTTHLDLMHSPFSENQDITPEQIYEQRVPMRNFRDRAEHNYEGVRESGMACIDDMKIFMSDTQAEKIMKSFIMSIDDVTKQFEYFADLFKNLKADDFKANVIKTIESVKKESAQLKQIVEDRIENYIKTDILSKSWMDSAGHRATKEEDDTPFNTQLFKQREEKLRNKQDLDTEKE
jgi:hypothetical protein